MKKKAAFDLFEISKARPHLLGLATLWVALFHSLHTDFFQPVFLRFHLTGPLNRLKETGNCGVDIFLFLSGLGLVFSWTRLRETSSHNLLDFYRRRFTRVVPAYLIVSIIYYGIIGTKNLYDWTGKIFLYGFYSSTLDGGRYWYFSLLFILYILFPLIWQATNRWGLWAVISMICFSVGGAMLIKVSAGTYFSKTEIIWTRIPVFLLGVFFGKLSQGHVRIPRIIPVLALPAAIALFHWITELPKDRVILHRYSYALLTVLIALAHAWLCSIKPWKNLIHRSMILIGSYSLEIYLIYENIYLMNAPLFQNVDSAGIVYAITVFVASLLLSVLLRMALCFLQNGELRKNT